MLLSGDSLGEGCDLDVTIITSESTESSSKANSGFCCWIPGFWIPESCKRHQCNRTDSSPDYRVPLESWCDFASILVCSRQGFDEIVNFDQTKIGGYPIQNSVTTRSFLTWKHQLLWLCIRFRSFRMTPYENIWHEICRFLWLKLARIQSRF